MIVSSGWTISIAVAACCLVAAAWLGFQWRANRKRILALDWPDRFEDWQKLKRYCRLFLSHNGWRVHDATTPEAELVIRNRTHFLAVQFLLEKHYYTRVPEHFLGALAVGAMKRNRPVALVTDFKLADDVVAVCRKRKVYPVFYKDLKSLDELTPTRAQFLQKELRRVGG